MRMSFSRLSLQNAEGEECMTVLGRVRVISRRPDVPCGPAT